ncbi:MAG: transglutaminase-like domain-containing protein [Flavobacterium sp.]|uniref:transglutaminase-like domain-containing protein n=1 Tax=Flavobacterium sp. TaxID=239 RepID=UPI003267F3CB
MKKLQIIFLLLSGIVFSQTTEKKVWDLLLANKREDARNLFDKSLKTQVNTKVEYFLLDKIIELESGKLYFDASFVEDFSKFPDSKYYLCSLFKKPFILDDIKSLGFTDQTYSKVDAMAASETFKNDPMVIYYKAIADRNRKNYESYDSHIKMLNSIMNWQLCGVFENLNDSGIDIPYEPETYPKNDKLFDANSNGKLGWYNPTVIQNEGYQTFSNESEYGNGIMYSQVFVDNPANRDVVLHFAMSASIKIFVNDVEIYVNTINKFSDLNAFKVKFKLPQGTNRILVKSSVSDASSYFFLSLTDTQNNKIGDLVYNNTFKEYNKSTLSSLAVEELSIDFEDFLIAKIKDNPNNEFYKFLLFDAYTHNKKLEQAYDIIDELDKKYPNSSIVKTHLAIYYALKDESAKVDEINKNIEVQDPNYYYTILTKAQDRDWMKSANIVELEKIRDKAKLLPSPVYGYLFDFLINARNSNITEMIKGINEILRTSYNSEFYTTTFAPLYDSLEKDKEKTIKALENLVEKRDNFTAISMLINYYRSTNRKEDEKKLYLYRNKVYPYFKSIAVDYINFLIEEKKYDEALVEIDKCLGLFPYSFSLMEKKGMVYNYKSNLKEAEKYMRQSLLHNSENGKLRKQMYDITKTPDEIEQIEVKDIYKVIKERKNSKLKSDYGVVVLLDEYIVNVLPEGGRKSKVVFLYEITGDNGIEQMKEYDLSNYTTLLKSEIVRADGSITPAEVGDGTLVFPDLKIGDVIYIEYEDFNSGTGRFYKDFNLSCYFNSNYPAVEAIFGLINPSDVQYATSFKNGEIPAVTHKIKNTTYTVWKKNNVAALPLNESFSYPYSDLTNTIKVGTIKSWKDISNWYSDLVKKNLELDKITKTTFQQIFPNGATSLSQDEIARKIYAYIENNITYSSLDFRQSGYVPQKPSKTIMTKLGDCKDVSTLFVALAQNAGLKSNLVLVSTNNNGFKNMPLPANDFNHCIVKTSIDGKDVFLELTDKYLPYKALPKSLYNANALIISFDKAENEKSSLIKIPFDNALKNEIITNSIVNLTDKEVTLINTQKIIGTDKSYFNELFSNATSDDVRKKELEEDYNSKLNKNIKLQNVKLIKNGLYDDSIEFETQLLVNEKIKNVGNLKIIDLPFIDKVYTRDIVTKEIRNYDINYINYENNSSYNSTIILNIPEGKKFTEIPESKTYTYKKHSYSINFELVKPNSLKISRIVSTPWDNITTAEYSDYKKYVEEVIANEDQVVGYK